MSFIYSNNSAIFFSSILFKIFFTSSLSLYIIIIFNKISFESIAYPRFDILLINLFIKVLSFLNKLLLNKEFINLFLKYLLSLNASIILLKSSKIFSSKEYALKISFNYKKLQKNIILLFLLI